MSNQKCRMCLKLNPPGSRFCNFCGNDLTFSIQPDGLLPPGAVLRGCYVIEDVIGEGGMGVVYRCHHRTLGTRYALKVLEPKQARIEILRRRFLAEAKIQATVRHPHIVHVLDVIDSEKDGGIPGVLAIVMEYVEGVALSQKLEAGPFSERDAVSSALVILDAIGFAHHNKIVHRDLKPSNIMISDSESKTDLYRGVKVMDFGIAKLLQEQEQRTVTGSQMGTPGYMAPEQIENARDVDERTDIYAIGLTLYEILCGRTPFQEYREFELIKAQLSMRPPSMRNYRRDISDRLEAIVMKALEKDRANRYPNAESFQRALLSLGGYDEIPLRLNPYEGTSIVPTNDVLQKKIKRAIKAMSDDAASDETPKAKTSGVSARKAAKRAAAQDKAKQAAEAGKVPSSERTQAATKQETSAKASDKSNTFGTPSTAKSRAQGNTEIPSQAPVNALARTESDGHIPRVPSHKSIIKLAEEKRVATDPGTPSRTFKRQKTSTRLSRVGKSIKNDSAEQVKAESANKSSAEQMKTESAGKSAAPHSNPQIQDSTSHSKSSKSAATPQKGLKQPDKTSKKSEQISSSVSKTAAKRQTPVKPAITSSETQKKASSRSSLVIKIVVVIIILLAAAGFYYRYQHSMPVPAPIPAPAGSSDLVEPSYAGADANGIIWKEIQTETGLMTQIPASKHWISGKQANELMQVELPAFAVDQVEVSYYQYLKCVEAQKCPPLGTIPNDLNLPVTGIGYGSALAFCTFAGKTLPTVAQWEAAARFGGETNGITHVNVTCKSIHFGTRKECSKINPKQSENVFARVQSANPGHLINMLGNVREWTSTADAQDKQKHHTKGGSYLSERADINIGATVLSPVNSGANDLGFRCVK